MKISKNVLKNMAAALVVGTTVSSCVKSDPKPVNSHQNVENVHSNGQGLPNPGNSDPCPACGMG